MRRFVGAAVAACVLAWGWAASAATIIVNTSGSGLLASVPYQALPGAGTYRIETTSSIPVLWTIEVGYEDHWDIYRAPPPRPHEEFIDGNSSPVWMSGDYEGTSGSTDFVIPALWRSDNFTSEFYEQVFGLPPGTLLYEERFSDSPYFRVYGESEFTEEFEYTIKVTLISSIPEPATWAMMIVGFGLAGAGLRMHARCWWDHSPTARH